MRARLLQLAHIYEKQVSQQDLKIIEIGIYHTNAHVFVNVFLLHTQYYVEFVDLLLQE